jgi:hypothetical protein
MVYWNDTDKPSDKNIIWERGYSSGFDGRGYLKDGLPCTYENWGIKINENFIANLSVEIKRIIAFYSTFVPKEWFLVEYLKTNDIKEFPKTNDIILANALGSFSTLEEAQKILLEDTIIDYYMPKDDFPIILKIKIVENIIYFEGEPCKSIRKMFDKYIIGNAGKIKYIK